MTPADLIARYEARRAEADRIGATAPLAAVYALVIAELSGLGNETQGPRLVSASAAASRLGLKPKTLTNWCGAGKVRGAAKTPGPNGRWLIPSTELASLPTRPRPRRRAGGWLKGSST